MLITKTIKREENVVVGYICNKCGETINGDQYDSEKATLFADWGYGSRKDGLMEQSEICEPCYDKFVDSFIHPPTELR